MDDRVLTGPEAASLYADLQARKQRQDSLTDQMRDVMRYAVESGCYDAHDWLVRAWTATQRGPSGDAHA